jgi:uncharacterized repeat protein (TIGR02543 family)
MKAVFRILGTIAIFVIMGFLFVVCDGDNSSGEKRGTTYTVTFNSNGGSAIPQITSLTTGATISKPTDPTKTTGYERAFEGWYRDNNTFIHPWSFGSDSVSSNVILYAKWRPYEIGETGPAGGVIFYRAEIGFTVQGYTGTVGSFEQYQAQYLEAAPSNEASSQWGAWVVTYDSNIAGVTTFNHPTNSEASLIGNGRKDTWIIVNYLGTSESNRAAQRCATKTLNGFNDWFLPSFGELNELYKAKGQPNVPTTGVFWSSSQSWANATGQGGVSLGIQYDSFTLNFANRQGTSDQRGASHNVRAIRAF